MEILEDPDHQQTGQERTDQQTASDTTMNRTLTSRVSWPAPFGLMFGGVFHISVRVRAPEHKYSADRWGPAAAGPSDCG